MQCFTTLFESGMPFCIAILCEQQKHQAKVHFGPPFGVLDKADSVVCILLFYLSQNSFVDLPFLLLFTKKLCCKQDTALQAV